MQVKQSNILKHLIFTKSNMWETGSIIGIGLGLLESVVVSQSECWYKKIMQHLEDSTYQSDDTWWLSFPVVSSQLQTHISIADM